MTIQENPSDQRRCDECAYWIRHTIETPEGPRGEEVGRCLSVLVHITTGFPQCHRMTAAYDYCEDFVRQDDLDNDPDDPISEKRIKQVACWNFGARSEHDVDRAIAKFAREAFMEGAKWAKLSILDKFKSQ